MSIVLESEESLGSGLDRQVARFEDLEKTISAFKQDLPSLKRQCERFRTERAALQTEITSLKSERDVLRLEVTHEFDRSTHLKEEYFAADFDAQGRANRRIWVLEQQNAEMKAEMARERKRHEEEVERERNVSSGLRDRIGALDEKRKRAQDALEEARKRETRLQSALDALRLARQHELELTGGHNDPTAMATDVAVSKSEAVPGITLCATPSKRASQNGAQLSSRSALQKRSPNVAVLPITPTKTSDFPSQPPSTTKKRSSGTSPKSLAKRCSMLEERHGLLKAEYDKLRTKYQEDIKHWKEWKAFDTARREEKKKRKEERSSRRSTDASNPSNPTNPVNPVLGETTALVPPSQESVPSQNQGPTPSQEPSSSQRVTRSQAKKRKAEDERTSEDQPYQTNVPETIQWNAPPMAEHIESIPMPPPSQNRRSTRATVVDRSVRDQTPLPRITTRQETPTPATSETRRKVTPAARVTAWLGTDPKPRSTIITAPSAISQDPFELDLDIDHNPTPLKRYPSIPHEGRSPLVRDRGEGPGPASSLRRTALNRTFSAAETVGGETPEISRARISVSPAAEMVKRRRLDMEGMSPAEKAQERKRLNKMTPAEKREMYSEYKGKGRYLPPDEVQRGVADEYEIDPKQNEGVAYPYHDVKRGRAERKTMHGGDCECCTGYYEAVGALPRYNAGPAWKDPSQHEDEGMDMTDAQVREHQNKVSRHRETWVKPPTPPGYWQIGFPNTQDVEEQNKRADAMVAEKEAKIRREAAHRDSKWKKKV